MKQRILSLFLAVIFCAVSLPIEAATTDEESLNDAPLILTTEIHGMVTAGTAQRIERAISEAEAREAEALAIILNTPGGLVDATLDILTAQLEAKVPVICYVAPQGAIAGSAGAFILLGGHVTAMSPGTTIGAAMPVTMSPDDPSSRAADEKTIQFLANHIRSIAENNGRPGDIAESFVTENLTLSNQEALELGVIDVIAPNLESLLQDIHGREVVLSDHSILLQTANAQIESIEASLVERITHLISNPQVTFILLLIGIYGLIVGFSNPGTFVPEVLGGISLVLALFGLGMFEVNLFASILILLGLGLLIAEALTPNYGILGVGGIVSLVLGILYLPVEPLVADSWLIQFRLMAIGIGLVSSVLLVILLNGILWLRQAPVRLGAGFLRQEIGTATEALDPVGYVYIHGELWKARAVNSVCIPKGSHVRVLDKHDMELTVEAVDDAETEILCPDKEGKK